jgi:hypothetical protein
MSTQGFRFKDTLLTVSVVILICSLVPLHGQIARPVREKSVVDFLLGRKSQPEPQPVSETETPTVEHNEIIEADEYAGWANYSHDLAKVSFRFPPGWNVAERLPGPNMDKGQYLTLTISPVDQAIRQADPTPFEQSLGLHITFDTAESVERSVAAGNPLFGRLAAGDIILESIEVNGASYNLVGIRQNSLPSSPIIQVELMHCLNSETCSWHIKRSDGSYLDLTIASQGNTRQNKFPVDANKSDYALIKQVIRSLKF